MSAEPVANLIARIIAMRHGLLPPYARWEEPPARTAEEYADFYNAIGHSALEATRGFLRALEQFERAGKSEEAIAGLLEMRRAFIRALPFCQDEIDGALTEQERQSCEQFILTGYRHPDRMFWTIWACREYEEILRELVELC